MLADGPRLRQVLDNLAANARLHTAPGSPVSFEVTVHDGVAQVVVADTGPGVAREAQQ